MSWNNSSPPKALFTRTGSVDASTGTVTLSTTITATGGITFDLKPYLLTTQNSSALTLAGDVTSNSNATISVPINGAGTTRKKGFGLLQLLPTNGTGSYSGLWRLEQGTLAIGSDAVLGASTATVVFGGGQFRGVGSDLTTARSYFVDDSGGSLTSNFGALTFTGTIGGVGSNTGALTIDGGVTTLSGLNGYSGHTNLLNGTLVATRNGALGTSTGSTTLAAGTTFELKASSGAGSVNYLRQEQINLSAESTFSNTVGANTWSGSIVTKTGSGTFATINVASGSSLDVSGTLASGGSGISFKKTGSGELILSGDNIFATKLDIANGLVTALSATALGAGFPPSGAAAIVRSGATLTWKDTDADPSNSTPNYAMPDDRFEIDGSGFALPGGANGALWSQQGVYITLGTKPPSLSESGLFVPRTTTTKAVIIQSGSTLNVEGNIAPIGTGTITPTLSLGGKGRFNYFRNNLNGVALSYGTGFRIKIRSGGLQRATQDVELPTMFFEDGDPVDSPTVVEIDGHQAFATQVDTGSAVAEGQIDTGTYTASVLGSVIGSGTLTKLGTGTLTTTHFRTGALNLQGGVSYVESNGGDAGTNRLQTLVIAGGATPSAKLDLTNNDLVFDYTTTSPMGNPSSGSMTVAQWIKSGWNGGGTVAWQGAGITTSAGNAGTFAVGYAEASNVLTFSGGTATFSGQTVDASTVLVKYTYYADASMDGWVNLDDYTRLSANFGTSGKLWQDGDFNYDGSVNLDDYTILSTTFGSGTQLRGGPGSLPPLAELYVAMLSNPQIYWEARNDPELWPRFAPFDSMNLGTIPDLPAGFRASIPEPASAAVGAITLTMMRRRRMRRG